jgi:quinol-cytochrome oxidoreductase complex cytochrome b subunit
MKISKIAAKVAVRLFFILVLIAVVPFTQSDNSKLQHIYLTAPHKWMFVFPSILVLGFITLTIICTVKKYNEVDLNWLLVLNTLILLAYCTTLYIHVYRLVK